jgi:DNA-binding NarL/FixJ family response regulator
MCVASDSEWAHRGGLLIGAAQRFTQRWIVESILAGASGYVLKEIKGGDIAKAVRMVASGESLFEPAVRARVLDAARGWHAHHRDTS